MTRSLLRPLALIAALSFTGSAAAQTVVPPVAPAPAVTPPMAPAPDPARLAVGRQIAIKVFPAGSYRKMLGENYNSMMSSVTESVGAMPMAQIAQLGGLSEERVQGLGEAKMSEVMGLLDPAWRERLQLTSGGVMSSMGPVFDKMEPRMREAIARAFARDFTLGELQEILRFLETPVGTRYGAMSITVMMDREVAVEMTTMMPEIMAAMPAALAELRAKLDALPAPRKVDDLSDEERDRLAALLGVDVSELNDPELVPLP